VNTRSQAKKAEQHTPLRVQSSSESASIDREKLIEMQPEYESLQKYWNRGDTKLKGQAAVTFEEKSGVLYRVYKYPYVNNQWQTCETSYGTSTLENINYRSGPRIHNGRYMGIKKTAD